MKNMKLGFFKTLVMILTLSLALAVSAASVFAAADAYPSRPIRLIVPFPPGGSVDIVGRLIATKLTERLGKQLIVDNRGGASGILGTEMAAKAVPDGYTLFVTWSGYPILPALYKDLPFDPVRSFAPVAKLGNATNSLVVHPSIPANSVKELIALAKQKPGQLVFVSSGTGSAPHMGTELFRIMAGINFKIVQFKGGGPAVVDLLGGHSHAYISTLITMVPHIKSGKVRALGTGGVKRSAILPEVPTIAESGLPGYESNSWWGVFAPAGTPAPIIDRLNHELKAILALEEVKKRFLNDGAEVDYTSSTEFGLLIAQEMAKWKMVVKEANIKLAE